MMGGKKLQANDKMQKKERVARCYSILTVEAISCRPGITMLLYTDSLSKFMQTWDYNVTLY